MRILQKKLVYLLALSALMATAGCSVGSDTNPSVAQSRVAVASYCPYLPSKTFAANVAISGAAFYEFRSFGNGPVADSVHTLTLAPTAQSSGTAYNITVNGTSFVFTCDLATCTSSYAAAGLTAVINGSGSAPVIATIVANSSSLTLSPRNEGDPISVTGSTLVVDTPENYPAPNNIIHPDPNPIRYAEVQVTNSSGNIIQCAETDGAGAFSLQLPNDGANYTVSVLSRANNLHNTAYVLSDPYTNTAYALSTVVKASGAQTLRLVAKVAAKVAANAGAYNILDQTLKAQDFLRAQTAGCASAYSDCDPFVTAPVLNIFWSPGVTPAVYSGGSGGISYYGSPDGSTAMKGLYLLGGLNGDIDNTDMDQFDNSVIVHEYGHFIEDNFGRMDSPGGSHNGNSVVDARLAWGEGWADFFQGAVLSSYKANNGNTTCAGVGCGDGNYRDTYGHVGCGGWNLQGFSGCVGVAFNQELATDPAICSDCSDQPTAAGEGGFREFSIARLMYRAVHSGSTPVSSFNEIWTVLHGPKQGMKVSTDRFKGIGRLHTLQSLLSGGGKWASLRSSEMQYGDLGDYATPVLIGPCQATAQTMNIRVTEDDDGSYSNSDQFRNNHFYSYTHPGGSLNLAVNWGGGGVADLDLYIYPQGYIFGRGWSAASRTDSSTTTGSESITTTLPAGTYLIDVMAYTGKQDSSHPGAPYTANGIYTTTYNLTVNGAALCPNYTKDSNRP